MHLERKYELIFTSQRLRFKQFAVIAVDSNTHKILSMNCPIYPCKEFQFRKEMLNGSIEQANQTVEKALTAWLALNKFTYEHVDYDLNWNVYDIVVHSKA